MAYGRIVVGIAGAIVARDIEALVVGRTVVGGGTHIPLVCLGAVDRFPSVGFGTIGKGADIGV